MTLPKTVLALAAVLSLGAAHAQTITGQDIKNDYDNIVNNGSFSVLASGALDLKSQDGYTGVGVQTGTPGEIDIREFITLNFTAPTAIASFRLGLLFNGPEYNDVYEVAQITVTGVNNFSRVYTLTTGATENVAVWSDGFTSTPVDYIVGAGTQSGEGGAITLLNPFGNQAINSIKFEAVAGASGGLCGSSGCTNQSDYNVVNVTAVPEPETYALMLAGLGAVAFVARRRRPVA